MRTFLVDAAWVTGTGTTSTTAVIRIGSGFPATQPKSGVPDAEAEATTSEEMARAARTVFTAAVQGLTI